MTDKLRELAERWSDFVGDNVYDLAVQACRTQLLSILDAEGDGGVLNNEVVGCLNVRRYRGSDAMVNHDFDYYGNLKDGTYNLYTHPQPARSGGVSDEQVEAACRAYITADRFLLDGAVDSMRELMRAALEHFAKSLPAASGEDAKNAARHLWLRANDNAHLLAEDVIDEAVEAAIKGESHG